MFHIVETADTGARVVVKNNVPTLKEARERITPGNSRPTVIDSDTGRTVAGPGPLGRANGRTALRRELAARSPLDRRDRRKAARLARSAAREATRLANRSKRKAASAPAPKVDKKKKTAPNA